MKKIDTTWFCLAVTFFIFGLNSSKVYLILSFAFLVMALSSKDEE